MASPNPWTPATVSTELSLVCKDGQTQATVGGVNHNGWGAGSHIVFRGLAAQTGGPAHPLLFLGLPCRYAGPMERAGAENILTNRSDGTFLVRQRVKDAAEFAISIK